MNQPARAEKSNVQTSLRRGDFIRLPSPQINATGDFVAEIPTQALQPGETVECKQFQGNPPGRRLNSFKMVIGKEFNEQQNPLDPETEYLAQLTGFPKRRIEECHRRWWALADQHGRCDHKGFTKMMKICGVTLRELVDMLFLLLDVEGAQKLDFEHFMRGCAVFKLGGAKVGDGYGYITQKLLAEESSGDEKGKLVVRESPLLKQRDLLKAQVRMLLFKEFYSEVSKEEKRLANLQVEVMMEMLQAHLDPADPMEGAAGS